MSAPSQGRGWNVPETAIFERLASALETGESAAVATVVAVEGSAYRRPGAKMFLTADTAAGSVTAGCLESDVADIADEVRASGEARLTRFDLTDDDEWGLGLGCNGVIDLLVEPLDKRFESMVEGYHGGNDGVALSVVESDAEPVSVGDRAYTTAGDLSEPVGLPAWLQRGVRDQVRDCFAHGQSEIVTVTAPDGGECRVFLDAVVAPPALYVFGSGADVDPVTELATRAGFQVTVVSFRGGHAEAGSFPDADSVISLSAPQAGTKLSLDETTYAVVMSHNLIDDRLAVEALLETPVPYIGVMGPADRFAEIETALAADGRELTQTDRQRIYAPIGLNLGGGAPYQIAMSIVSEVLTVHNGHNPAHHREREGAIHERSGAEQA
jgi:xanthine dehydrogenase accessory factor